MRRKFREQFRGHAQYQLQLGHGLERRIFRAVRQLFAAVVAIFGAAFHLGQGVGVAPVQDRGGDPARRLALGAHRHHQAGEQIQIGGIDVDLAGLVDKGDHHLRVAETPVVFAAVRQPLPGRVQIDHPRHRVLQAGARSLIGDHAVAQHPALQIFDPRDQRERADHRGQHQDQPQDQQQCCAPCGTSRDRPL